MKKTLIIIMFCITVLLVSCEKTPLPTDSRNSTTTSEETPTDLTTTTTSNEIPTESTTTPFVNPFEGIDFIRHTPLTEGAISEIGKSSGRLAYVDQDLLVYYGKNGLKTNATIFQNGSTAEIDTSTIDRPFILNYDVTNNVLYYVDNDYDDIDSIPQNVDPSIELYLARSGAYDYVNSQFSLRKGRFTSFKGEQLFSTGETTVFPYENMGDDLRFYSYKSGTISDKGCTIKSYQGFTSTPMETVVHAEYTCGKSTVRNRNIVIELIDLNTISGFVTIMTDGTIHVMDFATQVPNFGQYEPFSFEIINDWFIGFSYRDSSNETHDVVSSYDLSYIAIDQLSFDRASRFFYLDQEIRFFRYNGAEFRLYKNNSPFYTYTAIDSTSYVFFYRCGQYGVIYECGFTFSNTRMTIVNLSDGTTRSFDKNDSHWEWLSEDYLLCEEGDVFSLYDVANDQFIEIGVSGTFLYVNENYFLLYSGTKVYLYDMTNQTSCEMNRIGYFTKYNIPYAFLVEYQGEYYLIG